MEARYRATGRRWPIDDDNAGVGDVVAELAQLARAAQHGTEELERPVGGVASQRAEGGRQPAAKGDVVGLELGRLPSVSAALAVASLEVAEGVSGMATPAYTRARVVAVSRQAFSRPISEKRPKVSGRIRALGVSLGDERPRSGRVPRTPQRATIPSQSV